MAKFTERLVEKLVSYIEEDTFSVSEICDKLKINRKTFYEWRNTKPEFREAIERAQECRDDKLLMTARRSLKRKLEGYTLTEVRTTYVPDKDNPDKLVLKSRVIREKEYAPDTHAIKLTLSRSDVGQSEEEQRKVTPLNIVVSDKKMAENLEQFCKNLMNGFPSEERTGINDKEEQEDKNNIIPPNPSSETEQEVPAPEPEETESPDDCGYVRRYDLPPGYLYQRVKRSELRPGEKFTDESVVRKIDWSKHRQ